MNEIYLKVLSSFRFLILLIVEVFRFSITFWEIVIKLIVLILVFIIIVMEKRKPTQPRRMMSEY